MKTTPHTKIAFGVALAFTALAWVAPGCGETTSQMPLAVDGAVVQPTTFPDASACVPATACTSSACPPSTDGGFSCYWSCGQASLCAGSALFSSASNPCSSSGCAPGTDASLAYTVNETNARCVLTAMRDGTIGDVAWGTSTNDVDVSSTYDENYNLIAGRQAYGWWSYTADSFAYGRWAAKQLKPASYFQTCLDSHDTATYLSCLQQAFESCP